MTVDLGMDEDEEEAVPLPNVNAAILKKVIQWCTYHKDDPPPPEDDENKEKRTDDISSWDSEFLKVDQGTLFELILVRFLYFMLLSHIILFRKDNCINNITVKTIMVLKGLAQPKIYDVFLIFDMVVQNKKSGI